MTEAWTWTYENAEGTAVTGEPATETAFPTQSDAENWFGEVWRELADAGIAFHGASSAEFAHDELTLQPSGERMRPGRVVALPLLRGPMIEGVPSDPEGFISVSDHGAVPGLDGVYAAGDATTYPIKHGGVAAQQSDVIAATIAAHAGVVVDVPPLRAVLSGCRRR